MAWTELTVIDCNRNDHENAVAATTIDTSTGVYVDCNDIDASKLILEVTTTDAVSFILRAGMYSAEGIGDLTITSTGADTIFVGPLETARFKDTDGYIKLITSTNSAATTARAILLP